MASRYQIRSKNQSGTVVAFVTDFLSFRYSKRVNGLHTHALELNAGHPAVDLFELDGQIELYRADPEQGLDFYLEYEGFHRTTVEQTFENGRQTYTSYGFGYAHLLNRRQIWYPSTSAQSSKSDVAETVIKEFVDENAGPGATFPPRLLASGVFTGLTVEADAAGGATWTGSRAYSNLLSVLQEIGADAIFTFDIVGTGPAAYEFKTFADQRGTDRTNDGLVAATGLNAAGNTPVLFSLPFGNIRDAVHSVNRSKEANAVLVLGQGVEDERQIVQRLDAAAIAESPWNRIETVRNASRESTVAALNSVGDAILFARGAITNFNFTPIQVPSTIYGRDYFWGDKVTALYEDLEFDVQIIQVSNAISQNNELLQFEMEIIA